MSLRRKSFHEILVLYLSLSVLTLRLILAASRRSIAAGANKLYVTRS
ncbi:hypothetical protein AVDCRST_MAG84-3067 [uncultured Microcoleus sp.]|uniref:Uncharacterized protein n=1 Tax=uncultured Microcoleus sp. TaxID=259945 RepID=A0A6J4MGQ1_9CYAN|nr:hypothetical protein AVDCRST_MAG84-3067 [uncultured Microcoleus sp.]